MAAILVIDDDPTFCHDLAKLLRVKGHDAHEALDAADGLRALEEKCFDLVLCDMFMPEKDGLEVMREVRRRWPDVKVIAMSAGGWGGRLDVLPLAEKFGAAIIRKPFHLPELLTLIDATLSSEKAMPAASIEV